MIRSFHGAIRLYHHGMIRPFQGTNDLFRLNASYNVIIFDWFSFGPRSSFVHPSFILRSGFVRDSKNNQRSYEEATEMYLRHNEGTTKDEQRMNEAKTQPKRSQNEKDSFCLSKRFVFYKESTYKKCLREE